MVLHETLDDTTLRFEDVGLTVRAREMGEENSLDYALLLRGAALCSVFLSNHEVKYLHFVLYQEKSRVGDDFSSIATILLN